MGYDVNGVQADPLFTDAANANFTLSGGSPAIDAGIDWGQTEDFNGDTRSGINWDMGAFEWRSERPGFDGFIQLEIFER